MNSVFPPLVRKTAVKKVMENDLPAKAPQAPDPMLLKVCDTCKKLCTENYYFVNGNYYHHGCLRCENCKCEITPPTCVMHRGKLFCNQCSKISDGMNKCKICGLMVFPYEEKILLPGAARPIHKSCFACYECGRQLTETSKYKLVEDYPICEDCQPIIHLRRCYTCGKEIIGRYIKNHGKYFHIHHFRCFVCGNLINGKNYIVHHNKFYCPNDGQLYLKTCAYCKTPFTGEDDVVSWNKKSYHQRCFVCRVCGTKLDPTTCKKVHGRPHCEDCFNQRLKEKDVYPDGKTQTRRKHIPSQSIKRINRFANVFKKNIQLPKYAEHQRMTPGQAQAFDTPELLTPEDEISNENEDESQSVEANYGALTLEDQLQIEGEMEMKSRRANTPFYFRSLYFNYRSRKKHFSREFEEEFTNDRHVQTFIARNQPVHGYKNSKHHKPEPITHRHRRRVRVRHHYSRHHT